MCGFHFIFTNREDSEEVIGSIEFTIAAEFALIESTDILLDDAYVHKLFKDASDIFASAVAREMVIISDMSGIENPIMLEKAMLLGLLNSSLESAQVSRKEY